MNCINTKQKLAWSLRSKEKFILVCVVGDKEFTNMCNSTTPHHSLTKPARWQVYLSSLWMLQSQVKVYHSAISQWLNGFYIDNSVLKTSNNKNSTPKTVKKNVYKKCPIK